MVCQPRTPSMSPIAEMTEGINALVRQICTTQSSALRKRLFNQIYQKLMSPAGQQQLTALRPNHPLHGDAFAMTWAHIFGPEGDRPTRYNPDQPNANPFHFFNTFYRHRFQELELEAQGKKRLTVPKSPAQQNPNDPNSPQQKRKWVPFWQSEVILDPETGCHRSIFETLPAPEEPTDVLGVIKTAVRNDPTSQLAKFRGQKWSEIAADDCPGANVRVVVLGIIELVEQGQKWKKGDLLLLCNRPPRSSYAFWGKKVQPLLRELGDWLLEHELLEDEKLNL